MTTRAIQIDFLLAGLRDPDTGDPLNGGEVEFYEAGTLNAKNVWTEPEKTNAYTSYTLDSNGVAQLYGEGVYKVIVKDSGGNTEYTWDDIKLEATEFILSSKSGAYTATIDDDVILVDTTAGDVTITLPAVATAERPLVIKNTGVNKVIIDPNLTETIDGDSQYSLGIENFSVQLFPGTSEWKKFVPHDALQDVDADTRLVLADDLIKFFANDTQQANIEDGSFYPQTDDDFDLGKSGAEFKDLYLDGIAYVDEYDIEGTYKATMPSNGVGADAKFMLGLSTTVAWLRNNAAPPGWKVLTEGADTVLGVAATSYTSSGTTDGTTANKLVDSAADFVTDGVIVGEPAYNTDDGTTAVVTAVDDLNTLSLSADIFISGEGYRVGGLCADGGYVVSDWTIRGLTHSHTHTGPSHTHSVPYDNWSYQATVSAGILAVYEGSSGVTNLDGTDADNTTGSGGTGNTSDASDTAVSSNAAMRPKASVGKLFQLDTA